MEIKEIINSFPRTDTDRLKRLTKPYQVVSFDIFDTLIKRDVSNVHDVFSLAEIRFNREDPCRIKGFRRLRKEAEAEARAESHNEEVTIDEIYERLAGKRDDNDTLITEDTAARLKRAERWAELNTAVRNDEIYSVLKHCKRKGKRIILVSDMYWGREFIEELLARCGIKGYDRLYLSSEHMLQKRSGELFKKVLGEENTAAGKIVHIGDHKISDQLVPKKLGIEAIPIPRIKTNTEYIHGLHNAGLSMGCMRAFINNRVGDIEGHNRRLGYEIYGPMLYSFVRWLKDRIDPGKTVLFFARDCYVVKPAFEKLTGITNGVYFLASRRSLIVPALHSDASLEAVQRVIRSEPKKMSVEGLLKKIGLDVKSYLSALAGYGLSPDTVLERDSLSKNKAFSRFYESIEQDVRENARREYGNFLAYWNTLNCTGDIQVVDIGWRGTMQYCLGSLLPPGHSIKGYYLGVRNDALITDYEGFYLNGKEDFEKECFLASMTALIEIFFSAPHGSVKSYGNDGGAEYMPYECASDKSSEELVRDIQEGALRFVEDYSRSAVSQLFLASERNLFAGLRLMGTEPKRTESESFGGYPFRMGTGVVKAAAPRPLVRYIVSPRSFLYDFSNSNWKVAFLKKTMKLKLPYYKIFSWIYRHRG